MAWASTVKPWWPISVRVGFHFVGVVGPVGCRGAEAYAGDSAAYAAGFFVALGFAGGLGDFGGAVLFHIGEGYFRKSAYGDAVAVGAVVVDLYFGSGGQRGGAGGVVYEFFDLLQVHFVGIADVEIGYGAVGDYVGGGAAFGDHSLNSGFRADAGTDGVDVVEEVNYGF